MKNEGARPSWLSANARQPIGFSRWSLSFKVKINLKTAHDSYEAWREGQHDDLVLFVALAAWFAERRYRNTDWRLAKALSEVV